MLKSKSGLSAKKRNQLMFYIAIMALPMIQVLVFYFYVNFNSFLLAFQEYDGLRYHFVGFDSLKKVVTFEHSVFRNFDLGIVLGNTAIAWFFGFFTSTVSSVFFAYYIYKKHIGHDAFKVILYLPHIIPHLVFIIIYKYYMNDFLSTLGVVPIGFWTKELEWERFYYLFCNWMFGFGTAVLVYSGAMASISESIIESAQLDGITPFKEMLFIVVPMIWGTFVTMLVSSLVGFFTNDGNGYAFKGAQFNPQLQTIGYFMYNGTVNGGMGSYPILSAFGLIVTVIAVPVTLMTRRLLTKYGPSVD